MIRLDGRANDELRPMKLTRDYIKYPEGSCLIEMGDTRVICTASVEERVPPFLKNTGQGWITAEYGMLPRSCETRTQRESSRGQTGGRTQEIQRLVGRVIRSVSDLNSFGERTIWLDCDVLQADGGTRTAAVTGAFVAYVDACAYLKKEGIIKKMPFVDVLGSVSVGVVMNEELLDLNYKEDSSASIDMNVILTASGRIVEIHTNTEGSPFTRNRFNSLLDLAQKGVNEIVATVKTTLGDVL